MKLDPVAAFLVGSAISAIRGSLRNVRARVYATTTFEDLDKGADDIRNWMKNVAEALDRLLALYPTIHTAAGDLREKFGPIWNAMADTPTMSIEMMRQGVDGLCQAAEQLTEHVMRQLEEQR